MTDEQIVALYWERSEKAIEETDRAYGRYFRYIAHSILCDDEDSAEIVTNELRQLIGEDTILSALTPGKYILYYACS